MGFFSFSHFFCNKNNTNVIETSFDYSRGFFGLNLFKSYNQRVLLHNVTLGVLPGQIIGLFGPNGSGKSTTFGILTGLIVPEKGHVMLCNQNITKLPLYKRAQLHLGYVPQGSTLFDDLTLYDNLDGALWFKEKNKKIRQEHIKNIAQNFGFFHVLHHKVRVLSGGEKRKADIARLLLMKPRFLLLDEPLAGLDPKAVEDILSLLQNLCSEGLGILITEHHIEKIAPIVQEGYILYQGHIIAQGSMKNLIQNTLVQEAYLGKSTKI